MAQGRRQAEKAKEERAHRNASLAGRVAATLVVGAGLGYFLLSQPSATNPVTGAATVWDRVFTDPFLNLLRIALVGFGAFIAGGIIQRFWLGEFAVKAGSLIELTPLAKSVERTGEDINAEVAKATKALQTQMNARLDELAALVEPLTDAIPALQEQIDDLGK